MRLLLDTHIFVWSLLQPSLLTKKVASELEKPENELWISPATVWETIILGEKRRVELSPEPVSWIRNVLKTIPFREAVLTHEVAIQSRTISLQHGDPIDRFLAATAAVYDLVLVTADERLLASRGFATLANR